MIATVFGTMLDPLIVTLIVASVVARAAIVTDIGPVINPVISTESVIVIALVVAMIIALIVSVLEPSSSPSCPCLAFVRGAHVQRGACSRVKRSGCCTATGSGLLAIHSLPSSRAGTCTVVPRWHHRLTGLP